MEQSAAATGVRGDNPCPGRRSRRGRRRERSGPAGRETGRGRGGAAAARHRDRGCKRGAATAREPRGRAGTGDLPPGRAAPEWDGSSPSPGLTVPPRTQRGRGVAPGAPMGAIGVRVESGKYPVDTRSRGEPCLNRQVCVHRRAIRGVIYS